MKESRFSPVLLTAIAVSATLSSIEAANPSPATANAVEYGSRQTAFSTEYLNTDGASLVSGQQDVASPSTAPVQPHFLSSRDPFAALANLPAPTVISQATVAQAPTAPGTPAETTPTPEASPAPAPAPAAPTAAPEAEPRVLVAEVQVSGVDGELQDAVYRAIRTRAGRTTTRSQLQEDINAVFATGFFANVRVVPEDTPLGVRVTFDVKPNPVLTAVKTEGTSAVPQEVINQIFSPQYGKTLNLRQLQTAIQDLNKWYQDKGFVLAQVVDSPKVGDDGVVTLVVAEGIIESINIRFFDKEGNECKRNEQGKFELRDPKGELVLDKKDKPRRCKPGKTRPYIITREMQSKPGDVFNRPQVEKDLQQVFKLGIFEDVRLSLNPGQDPRKVDVVVNIVERNTGSIAAGAGISSTAGLFGSASYQQQNFRGKNMKIGGEVQVGERELLLDVSFTDPWIAGDRHRTSYTLNGFRRRTISLNYDGGTTPVFLPNGDRPRILRTGGGVTFSRPRVFRDFSGSLGLQFQRINVTDGGGFLNPRDQFGNPLSASNTGEDDLLSVLLGMVRDKRNDTQRPTSGSVLRFGLEQAIPIGQGALSFTRVRGSYSYYIPMKFLKLAEGPQTLAFNVQAGSIIGGFPGYEAFSLGGTNSVRGWGEGELGSGRSFAQATVEYRFPIFAIVGGALFVDAATDFGTGDSVSGNPAGIRSKPGTGLGYGAGVRVQTPLGSLRLDYGFNDLGESRIQFGIGERF